MTEKNSQKPVLYATDLEGVLIPEVWISFAEKTGIEKLRLTTRDISDYDELMGIRLEILDQHNFKLKDIQEVIDTMDPLPGAKEFLDWARSQMEVIILSDTFSQFAAPLMRKLGLPTLFCHSLLTDETGHITGYRLRTTDGKRKAVEAFNSLGYYVVASGDSYNDTTMLKAADRGILFRAPENVIKEFPQFEVTTEYGEVTKVFQSLS